MANNGLGSVVSMWLYPIKSMMGEEVNAAEMTERGLLGDRAYALIDLATGNVASAKNPRKWPGLFDFRASYTEPPRSGHELPPVRITLPDGRTVMSDDHDVHQVLTAELGREVALKALAPDTPSLEEYWPDIEGLSHRDAVTEEGMPARTFFDCASVHLLTTATIDRLRALDPQARFEVRRFRPNIVIRPLAAEPGFVENAWVDHALELGDSARVKVTGPCPRCVMSTLAQGDLPKDVTVLRTAAQHNGANVGIYADVAQPGTVRRGDQVRLI